VYFGVLPIFRVSILIFFTTLFYLIICFVCSYRLLLTCNCCEVETFGGCLGLSLNTSLLMYLPKVFVFADVVYVGLPPINWIP
jgi:hypothetical protein